MAVVLVGGGGDHCKAAGGYSGGAGESYNIGGVNGIGTAYSGNSDFDSKTSLGGGYYSYASLNNENVIDGWFGLGGAYYDNDTGLGNWSCGGSGGIAGRGGNINISENASIYAFNGDRITNGDYSTVYYQYDKDGNLTTEVAEVKQKQNNTNFIPAYIFIQSSIQRAVYSYAPYVSNSLLSELGLSRNNLEGKACLIQENDSVTSFGQGIGSGAGYIELSNGTYRIDSSLN